MSCPRLKKIWKSTPALGYATPTSYILEYTAEMIDYYRTGTIHLDLQGPLTDPYRIKKLSYGSQRILNFPATMGDVWCINTKANFCQDSYQIYGSVYGTIRVEWSRESILIEVLADSEKMSVYRLLKHAKWQPEIVGEKRFIRCKCENIKYSKNRYEQDTI